VKSCGAIRLRMALWGRALLHHISIVRTSQVLQHCTTPTPLISPARRMPLARHPITRLRLIQTGSLARRAFRARVITGALRVPQVSPTGSAREIITRPASAPRARASPRGEEKEQPRPYGKRGERTPVTARLVGGRRAYRMSISIN
jgi:hypothetical protein